MIYFTIIRPLSAFTNFQLTNAFSTFECVFWNEYHWMINQRKLFQNALECGKHFVCYSHEFVIALSVKPELDFKLNCFCFKLSNQPLPRPTHISRHNITRVTSSMKCRHRNVAARHSSLTSVSTSRRCPTTKTWTPSPASLSTMQVILPGENFLGIHKWRHS